VVFIGTVKWRREPNIPRLLVGCGNVRPDIAARAGVRGVSTEDLYR
jgi:hypothetical protein